MNILNRLGSMLVLMAAMILTLSACDLIDDNDIGEYAQNDSNVSVYYLQIAQSGELELQNGVGTLTLRDLTPNVIWVADRPDRQTSSMSQADFFSAWNLLGFEDLPPNAILESLSDGNSDELALVLMLSDPIYNSATGSVAYSVEALTGETASDVQLVLNHVALFIDSAQTGTLQITMTTTDGDALPGPVVRLESSCDVQYSASLVANENGVARFGGLKSCIYTITATMPGMQTIKRNVHVNMGGVTRITLQMKSEL